MKYAIVLLILCAACTFRKNGTEVGATKPTSQTSSTVQTPAVTDSSKKQEKELEKILHWFEQMDAIFRESLWVIRKEKLPQTKSLFGKFERALRIEMKQKLANKSVFKCDVYSMKRSVMGLEGVPQSAEVFHRCNSKESFTPIGEWNHPRANELTLNFRGGNLNEVLGIATSILSPKIQCTLKSNDNGIIEIFSCSELMLDFDAAKNQVLSFKKFEYRRDNKKMLKIQAEVLENLEAIRKIEVDVPLEGKITVTETVIKAPEFEAKPLPAPTAAPAPVAKPNPPTPLINPQEQYHGQIQNPPQPGYDQNQSQNQNQNPNPNQVQQVPWDQVPGYEQEQFPVYDEHGQLLPQQGQGNPSVPGYQGPPPIQQEGPRQEGQAPQPQQPPQPDPVVPREIPREQNTK